MSEQRITTDDPAFLKHEAAFWEDRYKTQHRTVHALESELSLSLAREQRLREALEGITEAVLTYFKELRPDVDWDADPLPDWSAAKPLYAKWLEARTVLSSGPVGEGGR